MLPAWGGLLFHFILSGAMPLLGQSNLTIYSDSLQTPWENWSWGSTVNLNSTAKIHAGSSSIATTITAAWGALYLAAPGFDDSGYTNLSFWISGGAKGGQQLVLMAQLGGAAQEPGVLLDRLPTNTWKYYSIPLSDLGVANSYNLSGIWFQDQSGAAAPVFYLDDVVLLAGTTPPPTNLPVALRVDAQMNRHPISPLIYGVAFASSNQLALLNATANRSGGNAETRYNWQLNAHNKGFDWYFESIPDDSDVPGASADEFVANSRDGGAESLLTVPMIGWVPKVGQGRTNLTSYSIAKYGTQTKNDYEWFADAGNGISTSNSTPITWNDPYDANYPTNSSFQTAWLRHLTNKWGTAASGGVRYYCMDNEHSLWHSTHQDVHHVGASMQEIRDRIFDYGSAVRSVDPNAIILAPEEWGWSGYFYSGYDQQYGAQHGWGNYPDRNTNGGWDYMPWLLDQMRRHETNTHTRLLDYFTLHIYPQSGEYSKDTSPATQTLRNQSTRALWDTNYVDASWIGAVVKLIPRMKDWVATYYPGTKIGITEYSWGADEHINGATAQADVLGIFGREGLDLATRWTVPDLGTPAFNAMKLIRNYDDHRSAFGDTSVSATARPNLDLCSAFAAVRSSDGALTVLVINKQLKAGAALTLALTNFPSGVKAQAWQLTSANVISRLSDVNVSANTLTNVLPPQSITLYVIPGSPLQLASFSAVAGNQFRFQVNGLAGQNYVLQTTTNFVNWLDLSTNALPAGSNQHLLSATNRYQYFRVRSLP